MKTALNKEEGIQLLKNTKEVLDNNKITFWLHYGTLLGAIRENGFIPGDDDIDLACKPLTSQQVKQISLELYNKGLDCFTAEKKLRIVDHKTSLTIWYFKRIDNIVTATRYTRKKQFRIFSYFILTPLSATYKDKVHAPNTTGMKLAITIKRILFYMPWRLQLHGILFKVVLKLEIYKLKTDTLPFTKLKTIKFYDVKVHVPDNYDQYLTELYDDEWMIPKKDWHWWDNKKGWATI